MIAEWLEWSWRYWERCHNDEIQTDWLWMWQLLRVNIHVMIILGMLTYYWRPDDRQLLRRTWASSSKIWAFATILPKIVFIKLVQLSGSMQLVCQRYRICGQSGSCGMNFVIPISRRTQDPITDLVYLAGSIGLFRMKWICLQNTTRISEEQTKSCI